MSLYKVKNTLDGTSYYIEAEDWTDPRLVALDAVEDDDGCQVYEVELECNHSDERVCEGIGHGSY